MLETGKVAVLQLIDSLAAGGAERVAVNLANYLPRDRFESFLCATRQEGSLAALVESHVWRMQLSRKGRFELNPLARLREFIQARDIKIVHAHGTALFVGAVIAHLPPYPKLIWHDHFGRYAVEDRPVWLYRAATWNIGAVISVNHPLAEWCRRRLKVSGEKVWYVPNFVDFREPRKMVGDLPGTPGKRVVCVANFRPEKDHATLLQSIELVREQEPDVHLLLVGNTHDAARQSDLERLITEKNLSDHVSLLGLRSDVIEILQNCDIGVLSSRSEGLPLALIEYGAARLAAVATKVGQCEEVLDGGRAGLLVEPGDAPALAQAIASLLADARQRAHFANKFRARVEHQYSAPRAIKRITDIYSAVLSR